MYVYDTTTHQHYQLEFSPLNDRLEFVKQLILVHNDTAPYKYISGEIYNVTPLILSMYQQLGGRLHPVSAGVRYED